MALLNLVRVTCATLGTGTLTLGDPIEGFLSVAQAGGVNGTEYNYGIEGDYVDGVATSREVGTGTWSSGGNTLTRSIVNSTNSNNLLDLSGDARVIITDLASDHLTQTQVEGFAEDLVGMVKLAEGTVTGDPTFVNIALPTGYRNYCLNINQLISNATANDWLTVQLSSDGGTTVRQAASSYRYYTRADTMSTAETGIASGDSADNEFLVAGTLPFNVAATLYGADFKLWIHEPRVARATNMTIIGTVRWSNHAVSGSGTSNLAAVDTAIRVKTFLANGISTMRYTLFGEQ